MSGGFPVGQVKAGEPLRNARPLSEIADALRESLLAEGARRERERLVESIARGLEYVADEFAAYVESQPASSINEKRAFCAPAIRDLARRVRAGEWSQP